MFRGLRVCGLKFRFCRVQAGGLEAHWILGLRVYKGLGVKAFESGEVFQWQDSRLRATTGELWRVVEVLGL